MYKLLKKLFIKRLTSEYFYVIIHFVQATLCVCCERRNKPLVKQGVYGVLRGGLYKFHVLNRLYAKRKYTFKGSVYGGVFIV